MKNNHNSSQNVIKEVRHEGQSIILELELRPIVLPVMEMAVEEMILEAVTKITTEEQNKDSHV